MKKKLSSLFENDELYAITGSELSRGRSNIEVAEQLLAAGIKIIQYREKDFSMKQKYRECCELRELTARQGALFIINDDVHLAHAVQSDGIHLGQDDLPVDKAREIVGEQCIIGLSTHSPEQADEAVRSRLVDYIGVGPIFHTFTKKDVCDPVGIGYLDYVIQHHSIPFVAIGGIKLNNVAELISRGARCVSIVSGIISAENIPETVALFRDEIKKGTLKRKNATPSN